MSIWIDDVEVIGSGKWIKYANVAAECYGLLDPTMVIQRIMAEGNRFDVLTFGQRLPDTSPRYGYHFEWEEIAALRLTTYENWVTRQITKENRKNISRARKRGVMVKQSEFTEDLVRGIKSIYDESPVRQGKKFRHFNKSLDLVRAENGTYLDRSKFICAYYDDQLVGFIKIFITEECANTLQVISKIQHRDKKVSNALFAGTVEICTAMHIKFLQYGVWSTGTLGQFKASNGFEKVTTPKYLVPLSLRGRAVVSLRAHNWVRRFVPSQVLEMMKGARKRWYERG